MRIFDNIKIEFDFFQLASCLCLTSDMPEYLEFELLLEAIKPHAAPAALLSEAAVIDKTPDKIISSLGEFNCPLLVQLADKSGNIFPFIVTCGKAMENFGADISDPLQLYWVDFLKEYALEQAFKKIKSEVAQKCPNEKITSLIPTDNTVWKIEGLKEIFNVFPAESIKQIGVELTKYLFMKPVKTRAGVFFSSHKEVDLCSLCSVRKCKTCPLGEEKKTN
ncbi:MAG: hypothetical protein KAS17_10290 [Victivallaceae bacterium]|nr:hypothetical protein [Victivallaceae bacterium]